MITSNQPTEAAVKLAEYLTKAFLIQWPPLAQLAGSRGKPDVKAVALEIDRSGVLEKAEK